jgi:hypothetical protein
MGVFWHSLPGGFLHFLLGCHGIRFDLLLRVRFLILSVDSFWYGAIKLHCARKPLSHLLGHRKLVGERIVLLCILFGLQSGKVERTK